MLCDCGGEGYGFNASGDEAFGGGGRGWGGSAFSDGFEDTGIESAWRPNCDGGGSWNVGAGSEFLCLDLKEDSDGTRRPRGRSFSSIPMFIKRVQFGDSNAMSLQATMGSAMMLEAMMLEALRLEQATVDLTRLRGMKP